MLVNETKKEKKKKKIATNATFLKVKQHCPKQRRSPAAQTGVFFCFFVFLFLILIRGIAIHTKKEKSTTAESVKRDASHAQLLPILCSSHITEATLVSKRNKIRQISNRIVLGNKTF